MAEGTSIPENVTPIGGETDTGKVAVASTPALLDAQTENKGFLSRLGSLLSMFGRKKEDAAGPQDETVQIKDQISAPQADRLNIETGMRFSDSTGSSRIKDNQGLADINGALAKLQSQLSGENDTTSGASPEPINNVAAPTPTSTSEPVVSPPPTHIQEGSTVPPANTSAEAAASDDKQPQDKAA